MEKLFAVSHGLPQLLKTTRLWHDTAKRNGRSGRIIEEVSEAVNGPYRKKK